MKMIFSLNVVPQKYDLTNLKVLIRYFFGHRIVLSYLQHINGSGCATKFDIVHEQIERNNKLHPQRNIN